MLPIIYISHLQLLLLTHQKENYSRHPTVKEDIFYNYFMFNINNLSIYLGFCLQLLVMCGRRPPSLEECMNVSDKHGSVCFITARPVLKTKQTSTYL